MKPRTSETHPLQIASLDTPAGGRIGMTFCPGKRDPSAMTGPWERDIELDLRAILDWGASAAVTLMEAHELTTLGVPDFGERVDASGMRWLHLPIRDVSIPDATFEAAWEEAGERLRSRLGNDESILVHCRGGLGRTGLIAARLLIELGEDPTVALARVRTARPGAVETREQEVYVLERAPSHRAI
ncbi:MAG: cyclin-dependent kinase inhibitor 3 family protein [Pseudomonadota bacterium]|nr:cyclin-dependent kinase inhibitor 3 family protein [Pseudomonadota bacterium]